MWLPWLLRAPYRLTGPHEVGLRDFQFLQPQSGDGNDIKLSPDTHLSARIFYPTVKGARTWSTPPALWLPHTAYAYGFANYVFFRKKTFRFEVLKRVLQVLISMLGTFYELPAIWNAPLAPLGSPSSHTRSGFSPASGAAAEPAGITSEGPSTNGNQAMNGNRSGNGQHALQQAQASQLQQAQQEGDDLSQFPVVIMSHGLAGTRNTYSTICCELASHGYVVVAPEHADGTASTARLAKPGVGAGEPGVTKSGWRYYAGLGGWTREATEGATQWRVREMLTSLKLLEALNQGQPPEGLHMSGLKAEANSSSSSSSSSSKKGSTGLGSFFKGRLDLDRVAVMGHSYGGASAVLAAAEHPVFKAVCALDPWWDALPSDSAPLTGWATQAPMLVLGSHTWNTPNAQGRLACGGDNQERALAAAARGSSQKASKNGKGNSNGKSEKSDEKNGGPGALLLVPAGSNHSSFDDIPLYFGKIAGPIFKLLPGAFRLTNTLPQEKAVAITTSTILTFLENHLPRPTSSSASLSTSSTPFRLHTSDGRGSDVTLGSSASGSSTSVSTAVSTKSSVQVVEQLDQQAVQEVPPPRPLRAGDSEQYKKLWPGEVWAIVRESVAPASAL